MPYIHVGTDNVMGFPKIFLAPCFSPATSTFPFIACHRIHILDMFIFFSPVVVTLLLFQGTHDHACMYLNTSLSRSCMGQTSRVLSNIQTFSILIHACCCHALFYTVPYYTTSVLYRSMLTISFRCMHAQRYILIKVPDAWKRTNS